MVNYCNVYGCHKRSDRETDRSFYRLPSVITNQGTECEELSRHRRRQWLCNLNQDFSHKNLGNVRVCSDHFINRKPADLYNKTSPDWAPTLLMGHKKIKTPELHLKRYSRQEKREAKKRKKQFLAYEFHVSQSTISRVFSDVINVLYVRTKPFVFSPEREVLYKTMPMEFVKHFGKKVAVIIDCFEIFIERPSNLTARAQTWSNYKHHNTVKFLLGITPQGAVSFVSKAWGGRASDKHITENSGFLDHILPGDVILADRGFDIQDLVGCMCAEAKIPAFTRGKGQLSALEVEQTRKVAHCRIHVERVIGLVRQKYTILDGTLPIDYLISKDSDRMTKIDKICYVCCALTNLNEPIVCFD
ncbi:uncharacterized protein LOC144353333 [Saccoglossus kowalevskii]